jgi:anti-sigma regulatory factor (Ser/Thr protein kinase)
VQRLRLLLVIEELFTNTVKYGRSVAPPVSVGISFEVEGSHGLTVRYEDTAPPYDPFEDAGVEEDLSVSVSKRRIGGLGIVLVRELGQDVQYAWSEGKNRVTFVVPLAPS